MVTEKMKIKVKESSMVYPSKSTPSKKIWNSNLDLVVARIHIPTVYFYSPNGASNFFDGKILRQALSNVLVSFFPMAGRLAINEEGRVEIDCNAQGALFVEAEAESTTTLADLQDFRPSAELRQFVPPVDYSGDISSYPLVMLQVTRFKCGGVAIGTGIHHTLADGLAGLHFVNTWSDIARGLSVAMPPFCDRTLLRARNPPNVTFDHVEYHPPPSLNTNSTSKTVSTHVFKLTLVQLNKLKSTAMSDSNPKEHSTYEILAAHLWRCASKARGLSDDQVTKLFVATDGRSRLCPTLPLGYIGNVVFTATPLSTAGELMSEPLTDSCKRIQTCLKMMDNEYLRSALDYLELQPDLSALVRGPDYFASPNLNINSWVRLPIYDSDFGWGRPIYMGPANILYEGTIYILPSPKNDRNLTLAVCLEADHMELFKKFLFDF